DPYELVRDDNLILWKNALRHIDAFFPSEDEFRVTRDAVPAIRELASDRLRLVGLKRGILGGQPVDLHSGSTRTSSSRATPCTDVTGAGDAFLGGFLAAWIQDGDAERGIEQGIVAASFAIQDWGARGLLAAAPADAQARLHEWFGCHTGRPS